MSDRGKAQEPTNIDTCRASYANATSAILESEIALFMKIRRLARISHGTEARVLRAEAAEIACSIRGLRRALRALPADPMPDTAGRMLAMRQATDGVTARDANRLPDDHRRVARGIAAMTDAMLELADRDLADALRAAEARHYAIG